MTTTTVIPTYGRDYKSAKEALADWHADLDFEIATFGSDMGRKISKSDASGLDIYIRYANLRKILHIVPS